MSSHYRALACLACLLVIAAEPPDTPPEKKSSPAQSDAERLPIQPFVHLGTRRLQQERGVTAAVFSPDGKTLAVNGVLWDLLTGKKLRTVQMPEELSFPIGKMAFSHDGKILAGECQNCIRLWETATGKAIRVLSCPESVYFYALTFSPDGKRLATSLWGEKNKPSPILLWDTASGREIRRFAGHERPARRLAFSSDGTRLTSLHFNSPAPGNWPQTSDPGFLVLWDVGNGKQLYSRSKIRLGVLSHDGRLYTVQGEDGRIEIHDLDKRRLLRTLESRDVCHVFSPDGKVLATTDEQNLTRLWNVADGRLIQRLAGRRSEERRIWKIVYYPFGFSADGKFLAAGRHDSGNHAGSVHLWDTVKGEELLPAEDHFAAVTCVAVAADGKTLVSGSVDRTLHLWDTADGRHLRRFTGHKATLDAVALSPSGRYLASSDRDKTLRLWDARTGRELHRLDAPESGALSLTFLPDDKTLQWWGLHGNIRSYDAVSGKQVRRFPSRRGIFYAVPLGADGLSNPAALAKSEEIAASEDLLPIPVRRIRNNERKDDRDRPYPLSRIRVSADGRMAATVEYIYGAGGERCQIRVWEVATGGLIADLGKRDGTSFALVFSLNGWGLFAGCDGEGGFDSEYMLDAWDLIARKRVHHLQAPVWGLSRLTLFADGTKLAAACADDLVCIWDVAGLFQPPAAPPLSNEELQRQGDALNAIDAAAAYRAMYRLARSPQQSVPFLHAHLRKLTPPLPQLRQLLADLDDDQFAVREKAGAALRRLGPSAESALRQARENSSSPEVRRRIDLLLGKLSGDERQRTMLTVLRGIGVLERIGTASARAALRDLTKTAPDADVGMEADAALQRLTHRPILRR